ncbi:MAG: glycosyltransferase, partial [bacterium]|nr:glycosyltransferase [bacterium]
LAALRAEGVTVVEISFWQRNTFVERLLEAVEATHPSLLLTINHLGFDEEGALTRLLEKLQLPIASWFVDSPSYILQNHRGNQSDLVTTFLWEEAYAKRLAEWFPNSVWLPLAGDERRLRAPAKKSNAIGTFVGDSQFAAAVKWRKRLPDSPQFDHWIAEASQWLHQNRLPIWEWNEMPELSDKAQSLELESAIVIEASRQYRWQIVQSLAETIPFAVYGDEGWQYAPGGLQRFPAVNYFTELPDVYSKAAFVLNLTSYQMPTAVNQRVFDVPLCGGILLTDRQSDLTRLFSPEAFFTFTSRDDATALAKWLLHKPEQAEEKRLRQLQTILEKHTYRHRVRTILQVMLERHYSRTSVTSHGTITERDSYFV